MPGQSEKESSIKSSEYSGTSQSSKKAQEEVMIDPHEAAQAVSSGSQAKKDREARKKAKNKT